MSTDATVPTTQSAVCSYIKQSYKWLSGSTHVQIRQSLWSGWHMVKFITQICLFQRSLEPIYIGNNVDFTIIKGGF